MTGFCMIRIFTEGSFRIVYTTSGINFSYRQRLYVIRRIKQFVQVPVPHFTDWFLLASIHTVVYFLVLLFCICSVCEEYEKVWTIIRRPQYTAELNILCKDKTFYKVLKMFKIVQQKFSFSYCVISFPSISVTRILVKAKRFFIDNKYLVKPNIAPPLFEN